MNFKPYTDEELVELNLVPHGEYTFKVLEAEERLSKAGNECMRVVIELHTKKRLVEWISGALPSKLAEFCKAINVYDLYKTGKLTANNVINKTGNLIVEHKIINNEKKSVIKCFFANNLGQPADYAPINDGASSDSNLY